MSLRWAAVEDLRIYRIRLCITQEEMNKDSKYKVVYSSVSLDNRSPCADGHARLIFCGIPFCVCYEGPRSPLFVFSLPLDSPLSAPGFHDWTTFPFPDLVTFSFWEHRSEDEA
jgi:hypothetical protein